MCGLICLLLLLSCLLKKVGSLSTLLCLLLTNKQLTYLMIHEYDRFIGALNSFYLHPHQLLKKIIFQIYHRAKKTSENKITSIKDSSDIINCLFLMRNK